MEGPSGLISALGGRYSALLDKQGFNRSIGELYLWNGSKVYIDGADDGALRIQGKNLRGAWCDEVGLWRDWDTAWNESLAFAVRLEPGRIVATGTPKMGHPLVKILLDDERVPTTHMRLVDNIDNLHPAAVNELLAKYQGTRLGRQELEGEFLEDVEGALWTLDVIERLRVTAAPVLKRIVVGVDPSGSSRESAHNAGIVVAGVSLEGAGLTSRCYVLADRSAHGSPLQWARAAVDAYHEFRADRIVAETNFGAEMVETIIRTVDPNVPVTPITASRGKQERAEPVAGLYEQGRVHHAGTFTELEAEMCSWLPGSQVSNDRMDALVWAVTELMVTGRGVGQIDYRRLNGQDPVRRVGDLVLRGRQYIDVA